MLITIDYETAVKASPGFGEWMESRTDISGTPPDLPIVLDGLSFPRTRIVGTVLRIWAYCEEGLLLWEKGNSDITGLCPTALEDLRHFADTYMQLQDQLNK